jgi:phospholipid/cholesterol/gamma-HCH transport system substrate-binding protein
LSRRIRAELSSLVALLLLALLGSAAGIYIAAHQRINPPSWMPIVGKHEFVLKVDLQNAQGILPGQGQMVAVSGVKVGRIASVDLESGRAVATLALDPKYETIYPDATVLMRPKTGLKDMVAELDPGSPKSGMPLGSGAHLSTANTNPDVNFDEILASLDRDSRTYLQMLVQGAGIAFSDGGGHDLANTFRRFDPLARDIAKASGQVAVRRARLRHVMANLSKLATELGGRDRDLAAFVSSSEAVFKRFAHQSDNLQRTIDLLPPALDSSNRALAKAARLGKTLDKTLTAVEPTARTLAPTLRDLRPFFNETTPVIKSSLRPFARDAQPTAKKLVPAAHNLADATPNLTKLAGVLNAIVDELAFDPPGNGPTGQSYLFYVPWANHNTNSTLAQSDGIAPLRRGMVLVSCGGLTLLDSLAAPKRNPTLSTLIQLLAAPDHRALMASGKCPKVDSVQETAPASASAAQTSAAPTPTPALSTLPGLSNASAPVAAVAK